MVRDFVFSMFRFWWLVYHFQENGYLILYDSVDTFQSFFLFFLIHFNLLFSNFFLFNVYFNLSIVQHSKCNMWFVIGQTEQSLWLSLLKCTQVDYSSNMHWRNLVTGNTVSWALFWDASWPADLWETYRRHKLSKLKKYKEVYRALCVMISPFIQQLLSAKSRRAGRLCPVHVLLFTWGI